jgi:CheY-like chemotaxis protein
LTEYFNVQEVVSHGETLIERTEQLQPDLIVTDVSLKGLDGLSALRVIRRRYPNLPIVVMTGHIEPGLRDNARLAGASAFLHKLDGGDALVVVLRSLLR